MRLLLGRTLSWWNRQRPKPTQKSWDLKSAPVSALDPARTPDAPETSMSQFQNHRSTLASRRVESPILMLAPCPSPNLEVLSAFLKVRLYPRVKFRGSSRMAALASTTVAFASSQGATKCRSTRDSKPGSPPKSNSATSMSAFPVAPVLISRRRLTVSFGRRMAMLALSVVESWR